MKTTDLDYPKLRFVEAFPLETNNGPLFGLRDPNGIASKTLIFSQDILYLLQYFDGSHSLLDLRSIYHKAFGDFLHEEQLAEILDKLDRHFFLQSRQFEDQLKSIEDEFRSLTIRPAVHAGTSYHADPAELRKELDKFFDHPRGAGRPDIQKKQAEVRGLIAPHVDLRAGGPCYSHAYRALAESTGAECFVILGTGHSGLSELYSTLPNDYATPFGPARCDREFIDLLRCHYPGNIEADVLAHKNEHVIEFQLAFLKYLYEKQPAFTFVPVLCSFSYHMLDEAHFPRESTIIEGFCAALKKTISEIGKKVCIIASVDFSHVGPRYGDRMPLDQPFLALVKAADWRLLQRVQSLDWRGFHECLSKNQDCYRVCGFSSIYTLLKTIEANQCRLLDYASTEVDNAHSTVTFASLVFS